MSQSSARADAAGTIDGDVIYHTGASNGLTGNTLLIGAAIIGAVLLLAVWFYKKK